MNITKDVLEWKAASGTKVNNKAELLEKLKEIKGWLDEEFNEFVEAVENDDVEGQYNAVIDGHWILDNLSHYSKLSLEKLEEEANLVKLSNYTKYCQTQEEALESVRLYADGLHPNKMGVKIGVIYRMTNVPEYPFVLLRASDAKILKSHKFKDVDEIRKQLNDK